MTPDPEPSAKERIDEVMAFLQYAMQKDFAKTVFDLVAENTALRADKERLDWLEKDWNLDKTHRDAMSSEGVFFVDNHTSEVGIRAAIDVARKEQP